MIEELIKCIECGQEMPRSQYRQVGKPEMCKSCIAERKAKRRLAEKVEKVKATSLVDNTRPHDVVESRTALRMDQTHREVLDALTRRLGSNQSVVVERALDLLFGELFTKAEQELILGYAGLFSRAGVDGNQNEPTPIDRSE